MMKHLLYIDCDPGIDDALALAYLLNSPEASLLGIGTICGNVDVEQASENALRLLALADRSDVPLATGESRYLAGEYGHRATRVHGANGLGDVELPAADLTPAEESAVEMILRLSREYECELEICALGPLTNLARALEADPQLAQRVKRVVAMGGAALVPGNVTPVAEANIFCDPEAARLVLRAPWEVTLVGLDVTLENVLEESHRDRLLASERPFAAGAREDPRPLLRLLPAPVRQALRPIARPTGRGDRHRERAGARLPVGGGRGRRHSGPGARPNDRGPAGVQTRSARPGGRPRPHGARHRPALRGSPDREDRGRRRGRRVELGGRAAHAHLNESGLHRPVRREDGGAG